MKVYLNKADQEALQFILSQFIEAHEGGANPEGLYDDCLKTSEKLVRQIDYKVSLRDLIVKE
jgi:hypothetical protein